MLKDNHIGAAGGITEAVNRARAYVSFVNKIEVEVENIEMAREAAEAGADIIMLDNMTPEQMKEAIKVIDGRALTECSGNVTKENIKKERFCCDFLFLLDFASDSGRLTEREAEISGYIRGFSPI